MRINKIKTVDSVSQIVRETEELARHLNQSTRLDQKRYQKLQKLFFQLINRLNRETSILSNIYTQVEENHKIKKLKEKFFRHGQQIQTRLEHLNPTLAYQKKADFYLKKLDYHQNQIEKIKKEFVLREDPIVFKKISTHEDEARIDKGNLRALLSLSFTDPTIIGLQEKIASRLNL